MVIYLGRVLLPAIIAMLIVYCLEGILLLPGALGAPADGGGRGGGPPPLEAQQSHLHFGGPSSI